MRDGDRVTDERPRRGLFARVLGGVARTAATIGLGPGVAIGLRVVVGAIFAPWVGLAALVGWGLVTVVSVLTDGFIPHVARWFGGKVENIVQPRRGERTPTSKEAIAPEVSLPQPVELEQAAPVAPEVSTAEAAHIEPLAAQTAPVEQTPVEQALAEPGSTSRHTRAYSQIWSLDIGELGEEVAATAARAIAQKALGGTNAGADASPRRTQEYRVKRNALRAVATGEVKGIVSIDHVLRAAFEAATDQQIEPSDVPRTHSRYYRAYSQIWKLDVSDAQAAEQAARAVAQKLLGDTDRCRDETYQRPLHCRIKRVALRAVATGEVTGIANIEHLLRGAWENATVAQAHVASTPVIAA